VQSTAPFEVAPSEPPGGPRVAFRGREGPTRRDATALAFAPICFANLILSNRFKGAGSATTAFAVDRLGAMIGGLLEYFASLVGYGPLLFVVAGAYPAASLFGRSHLVERPDVPAAVASGSP